ncbi:hypothetical protein MLD38_015708 [Melastoma candidum]|uniref:Uncharacterized protein n=1 Tax=Melastoma candidum TaxID=119954 RepID=A0ACB9RH18_9MYRT|nr:hypothetical protein MLD38_015708 [Melastoma candidum]
MARSVKDYTQVLALLTLLVMSGSSRGLDDLNPVLELRKEGGDGRTIYSRKLLAVGVVTQDYDDVCPNPKHDPRKKPGCKNTP